MKEEFGFNWGVFGLNPPKIDGFDTKWMPKKHVGKKPRYFRERWAEFAKWEVANDYKIPKGFEHLVLMKRKK
tara:strand:- start:255 stop:470 length:216 start_codon:yes stop_codon:yes gene_type:complete